MKREKFIDLVYRFVLRTTVRPAATPTREQRIDWAHGSAVVENPDVTREMVVKAVDKAPLAA
jgi:hypothetical protein